MKKNILIVLLAMAILVAALSGAVMWRSFSVAGPEVGVMWHSATPPAETDVAVMWHTATPPADMEVAVMWRSAAFVAFA